MTGPVDPSIERVTKRLEEERAQPDHQFVAALRRGVVDRRRYARRRAWLLATAYAAAGILLLGIAAAGLAGAGPFGA